MPLLFFRIAATLCFLAVALGAFGAHSLKSTLETNGMLDVWNKAVLYHFIHAITLFVLALYGTANRGAWWLLFAGIFLFSVVNLPQAGRASAFRRIPHCARRMSGRPGVPQGCYR